MFIAFSEFPTFASEKRSKILKNLFFRDTKVDSFALRSVVINFHLLCPILERHAIKQGVSRKAANSHFPRPAGPHFPARQGHIKRPVLESGTGVQGREGLHPASQ